MTQDYPLEVQERLYWHRWDDARGVEQVKHQVDHDAKMQDLLGPQPTDRQTTLIQPIATHEASSGQRTTFTGRTRFENLSDLEVGALMCAFNLPEGCAHKIGMAKPLGLGSIRITPTLRLIDRDSRYSSWGASGVTTASHEPFVIAFTAAAEAHAQTSGEALIPSQTGLRRIARLDALFQMLDWQGRLAREKTEYLKLEDFRSRRVLPTPHSIHPIHGQPEPSWPGLPPTPRAAENLHDSAPQRTAGQRQGTTSAGPSATPEPPAKRMISREKVTLEKRLGGGKARVKLESGEMIECTGINAGSPIALDNTFIADVERVNGKPIRAKYKGISP